MVLICEFCGKNSATKYTLKRHQQSKFCLKHQNIVVVRKPTLYCDDCNKEISTKGYLKKHQENCVEYVRRTLTEEYEPQLFGLEMELETARAELDEAHKKIKELESRPTTIHYTDKRRTTYNTLNYIQANFKPITQKLLDNHAETITHNDLIGGGEDMARFALSNPDINIVCTDYARRICKYLDDEKIVTDHHVREFAQKFFQSVYPRSYEIIEEYIQERKDEGLLSSEDEVKYNNLQRAIRRASQGGKTELHPAFAKTICANTKKQNLLTNTA